MTDNKVYLIDASIYVFKSYYSNNTDYTASNGENINAVYGFTRFLTSFLHQTQAKYIACAFDESLGSSYRNDIYPPYKANRDPAPEDLKRQFKLCQEVANVMGVKTYRDGYYEADDLIGTLASHYQNKGFITHIVSADKDLAQLVTDNDFWWNYGKAEPYCKEMIYHKFGVYPQQIADYLALAGDAVDNIPGIPGIGGKTAAALLNHFGNLSDIIKRHKEISYLSIRGAKSCQKKISSHINTALLSRKLTGIKKDIPLDEFDIRIQSQDHERLQTLFNFLKLGPILRKRILDLKNI